MNNCSESKYSVESKTGHGVVGMEGDSFHKAVLAALELLVG